MDLKALLRNHGVGLSDFHPCHGLSRQLHFFTNQHVAGETIVGAGPVLFPLQRVYRVPRLGLFSDFLLGLATAQAFPGPKVSFAGYLGALLAVRSTRRLHSQFCV